MGAGIVAAGVGAVSWSTMGAIAASWVISPLLGGIIAAAMLAFIKWRVIYVEDKIAAARTWVPVLIGLMSAAFAAYLALKGLSHVVKIGLGTALLIGGATGALLGALSVPFIKRQSEGLENRNRSLKTLFRLPLLAEWVESGGRLDALIFHVVVHEIGHHFGLSDDDMHALEDGAGD